MRSKNMIIVGAAAVAASILPPIRREDFVRTTDSARGYWDLPPLYIPAENDRIFHRRHRKNSTYFGKHTSRNAPVDPTIGQKTHKKVFKKRKHDR